MGYVCMWCRKFTTNKDFSRPHLNFISHHYKIFKFNFKTLNIHFKKCPTIKFNFTPYFMGKLSFWCGQFAMNKDFPSYMMWVSLYNFNTQYLKLLIRRGLIEMIATHGHHDEIVKNWITIIIRILLIWVV